MRGRAFVLALLAAACGGDDAGERGVSAADIDAWGLGGAGRSDVAPADAAQTCKTVIVFVIDRVTKSELRFGADSEGNGGPDATPHLDAVAAGGDVAADAITPCTGGNAALASLLTGSGPARHGVGTLHDVGRATLMASAPTLPEAFQAAGWATLASLSSPRHARGFSGFAAGFDDYAAPRVGERVRDAGSVVNGARSGLDDALRGGRRVFALYAFEGPGQGSLAESVGTERLAPFVMHRLGPLRDRSADVDAALARMEDDPGGAIEDLEERLGRARGSELANALAMARRDASLAAIDDAVGSVLAQLEASGRAEHAMIAIVGLRGDVLPGARDETGPRLLPSVLEVPLALRYPCGAAADLPTGPLSLADVPRRLADVFGEDVAFGGSAGSSTSSGVLAADARFSVTAFVTRQWQYERHVDGQLVVFDRSGQEAPPGAADPAGWLSAAAESDGLRTEFEVAVADWAPAIELSWHVAGGRMLAPTALGEPLAGRPAAPSSRGSLSLSGERSTIELPVSRRGSALRLGLELAGGQPETSVLEGLAIGDALARDLPLLLAPRADGPRAPEGDGAPPVTLTRTSGLWWTLAVAGEGPTELLVSVWPPRDPTDPLEVSAGGAVRSFDVRGRRDLVRLVGTAPFDLRVKKVGSEDFLVACRLGDRFVGPGEISFNGLLYGEPSAAEFVLFDWQPAYSEVLPSVDDALYVREDSMPIPPAGAVRTIRRRAPGGAPVVGAALDLDGLEFVRMLLPGE